VGSGGSLTFNTVLSGTNALTIASTGSATLLASGNTLGAVTNAGTLSLVTTTLNGSLAVNGGSVTSSGTLTLGTTSGITSNGGGTISGGSLTLATAGNSVDVSTGSLLTIGSTVTGGTLTKTSAGTLALSDSNVYSNLILSAGSINLTSASATLSGSLAVNAGQLSIGTLAILSSGGITSSASASIAGGSLRLATNGSSVDVSSASTLTISSTVTGGTLTKTGAGKLSLSEATVAQDLVISGGSVALTANSVVLNGSLAVNNGTLALTGTGTLTAGKTLSSAGTGVVSGGSLSTTGLVVDVTGNSLSVSSAITGIGSVTKTGTGILALTGANTFTGGVVLGSGSGTVSIGNASALGSGTLTINGGGSLDSTTSGTVANAQVWNGGTVNFVGSGANSLNTSGKVTLGGSVTLNVAANTLTLGGAVSGGTLTKSGNGTLVLSGTSNYTGDTTVTGGSLVLAVSNALYNTGGTLATGALTINKGGTLSINAGVSQSLDTLVLGGSLLGSGSLSYYNFTFGPDSYLSSTLTSKLLFVESSIPTPVAKTLSGGNVGSLDGGTRAAFNVTGSTTATNLSGNSVTVSSGTLTVNGTLTTSSAVTIGAGSLTMGTLASMTTPLLSMGGSSTVTLGGTSALNNVTKLEVGTSGSSSATLVLSAGTTTFGGGSLAQTVKGSGKITVPTGSSLALGNNLTLAPGNSPGTLSVVGSVTLSAEDSLVKIPTFVWEYTATGTLAVADRPGANDYLLIEQGSLTMGASTLAVSATAYNSLTSSGSTVSDGTVGQSRVNDTLSHQIPVIKNVVGGPSNFKVTSYVEVNSLGGSYASAPARTATVTATPKVESGSLYLTIQRTPFATIGSTQNVAALGRLLDNSLTVTTGGVSSLIDLLDTTAIDINGSPLGTSTTGTLSTALSYASINAKLQGINPAGYAELANIGFDRLLDVQLGLVNHLRTLALPGLQSEKDGDLYAWTSAYGGWTKRDSESSYGSAGYSSSNAGNLTGVEKRFGKLTLGLTGAVGSSSSTLGLGMGSVTTDTWHVGLYGSSPLEASGRAVVLDAAFVYGNGDTTFKRDVSVAGVSGGGSTSAKATNSEWLLQFGAAVPFRTADESLTVTHSIHLVLAGFNQNALNEGSLNGLGALVSKQNATSTAVRTGVQIAKLLKLANKETRLTASLDWVHSFDSDRRDVDIALTGSTGGSTKFQSSKAGGDAARLGLGGEMALTPRTRLRLNLDEQVQSNQSSTNGSVSIGVQF
jgi:fibronectin-binding autotransporter adhesin